MKNKILISFILCILVLFSINTVYATEGDSSVNPTDGYYVEGEDGPDGELIFVPNETEPKEDESEPQDNLQDYDMETLPTESPDNNSNNNSNNNNNSFNNTTNDTNNNVVEDLGTGNGSLFIKINVTENFYENILVLVVDMETQKTIQIPVYASNEWMSRSQLPAGKYFVLNAISTGDDANEQEWIFSVGEEFVVKTDETTTIKLDVVIAPEGEVTTPTETPDETFPDNFIGTEMKPEDTMTDEELEELNKEELTTWQHFKNLVVSLVSGPNLILLAIGGGLGIAYYFYKKRREDD